MIKLLGPVLSVFLMASTSHAFDSAAYQARVTDAAAHFLIDVSIVKLMFAGGAQPSQTKVCYQLGTLSYTTNSLFNLAANGDSTEARREAAKQILQAKADFLVTCGNTAENTEAFQLYKLKAQRLTTMSQIQAKLSEMESIAKKIQQGEVR